MIEKRQQDVVALPLDPVAEKQVWNDTDAFMSDVLLEAKANASRQGDNVVLVRHVHEARATIERARDRSLREQIGIMVGGACVGAFISGFSSEMLAGPSHVQILPVVTYVVMGFLGLLISFVGLRR